MQRRRLPGGRPALFICDVDSDFCEAASLHFRDCVGVEVVRGRLEEVPEVDCIVWPGNCQALCASGLDRALAGGLGGGILERVRGDFAKAFGEEGAPLGTAVLVELEDATCRLRYVVFTVVFPRRHDGPRLAMLGVLRAVQRHNAAAASKEQPPGVENKGAVASPPAAIAAFACPGLGTFAGCPDVESTAAAMAAAFRAFAGLCGEGEAEEVGCIAGGAARDVGGSGGSSGGSGSCGRPPLGTSLSQSLASSSAAPAHLRAGVQPSSA